ncbi:g12026 [Coccomyxa viridis]|uniref:heme oxygenase (biliverdin-producing) n=1 Tax=Coccomyxa viridis TaxID=1274662 RepID=A0ABP1GC17_9CHLO
MRCVAAAPSTVDSKPRPGEKKGFVEEMRFVAMRLHTRDQAPKEGEREAAEQAWKQWQPSREGYLRFLTESKEVYETLEGIVAEAHHPDYARFQNTGLERSAGLAEDIAWMQQEYSLAPAKPSEDGPGQVYSRLLRQLADEDPPVFLCHFYNIYFAHTAGGRMIGTKVASMILDSRQLNFYKYNGDHKPMLEGVREQLNETAEGWSREEKDRCLNETQKSFKYSGDLLRCITQPL